MQPIEGEEVTRRPAQTRVQALPWPRIAGVVVAIGIGAVVGAEHGWLESEPGGGLLPSNLFYDLITAVVVGLVGLIGLIAAARRSASGRGVLLGLLLFGVGWGGGATVGPRWQYPREVAGGVTLHLIVPVAVDLSGPATCTTEANGDRVVSVSALGVGTVGVDELDVRVQDLGVQDLGVPTIEVLVNGTYGYAGQLTDVAISVDTLTGSGSFTSTAEFARIGGPTGSATASGSLEWTCTAPTDGPSQTPVATTGGPEPSPTALVVADAIQGYFDLHGLVEWITCPPTGPCQPYGHASGACSSALDLRTDGIETVVPWTAGAARLHVVPGREITTLTVTLDDGSAPETVTATTVLTERQTGPYIGNRSVEGDFALAEGTLHLYVEWECGGEFEGPAYK